jgi:hypothetical protein
MKFTKLLIFFILFSLKGFSQQPILTPNGERVVLYYLSLWGGTISGTLSITGATTITGTTNIGGLLTTTGGIANTGALTNTGNLTVNGNGTITGTLSVGTITSGVWSGTAVAVEKGGTGATTSDAARTNLGLVIGTDVQAPLTAGTDYLVPTGSAASLTNFPTLNQSTTGNAATATKLSTARNINGVAFDGTSNITVTAAAGTLTGSSLASNVVNSSLTSVGTLESLNVGGSVSAKNYILTVPSTIASTTTTNINLSNGNVFKISLGSNITTLTLSNANIGTYILEFIQTTGNFTVAFPADWKWSGGSVPTITATANKTDIVTLIYDGTTYFASAIQNF